MNDAVKKAITDLVGVVHDVDCPLRFARKRLRSLVFENFTSGISAREPVTQDHVIVIVKSALQLQREKCCKPPEP